MGWISTRHKQAELQHSRRQPTTTAEAGLLSPTASAPKCLAKQSAGNSQATDR
jgi:hypothetical protein